MRKKLDPAIRQTATLVDYYIRQVVGVVEREYVSLQMHFTIKPPAVVY